jgi:Alpha amylase, catalytic domain
MAIQSRLRVVCAMMPVTLALTLVVLKPTCARADVILQYFEGRYETIERRIPDIFMAGYDALWLPPTGLADSDRTRSQPASVGYDVFDRFGLGTTSKPTLYGTESQLRRLVRETHKTKILIYADIVLNHNGFSNQATPGFVQAGDYPGFALTLADDVDGDFHGASEAGRLNERINGGLVDIAQEKNHRFIRHPVQPYVKAVATVIPSARHVRTGLPRCRGYTTQPIERSHVPTRDRLRGARGLRTVRTGQRFLESFEAFHALRRGMVKLRPLMPRYRPSRASVHETTRAIVMAMDVLGTQLRKAA